MAVALVTLSFICAGLLAVFVPVKRVRTSIPHLAIIVWLLGHNLIHAINAAVWAGNVDIHVPIWCDIVTKVLLGIKVALPGALRTILKDRRVLRNRMIFELFLCYVLPTLYMLLHLVIQDRSIALIISGVSIHNSGRVVGMSLSKHLETRSTMTASQFNRQLIICMTMAGSLVLLNLSTLFSIHSFEPWTSWSSVHAFMTKIEIIKNSSDVKTVQFLWWSMFAISVLYIILLFAIAEDGRDLYRWVREQATRKRKFPRRLELPLYLKRKPSLPAPEMISRSPSLTKSHMRPLTIELKSGWEDDLLDDKKSKRRGPREDVKPPSFSSRPSEGVFHDVEAQSLSEDKPRPDSPLICASPTMSCRSISEDDQMFMESTISYLSSPTAKTLGILPPLQIPPPAKAPPPPLAIEIPQRAVTPPPALKPKSILKAPRSPPSKPVPTDIDEPINSVFDAAWPVPPLSPVPTMAFSTKRAPRPRSRSHSPASAAQEVGYPLCQTSTPPHRRARPFEGSSISSVDSEIIPSPLSPTSRKAAHRQTGVYGLRKVWSKERLGQGSPASQAIHMTVVKEIA
ncbi:Pheromone B beta 1 receptor [Psilocybe cubensis]|uniref:Pheromone B beta 1 receptor n=1 Tax=Psilocybe cubensis TaxID=181762 RepID=A0ACB8GMD4_PSICU|nr:Pheromone B beta 1 receptor [Psilocybe cubensis]KAH9476716.1 Pheromone B beta 1 receptor [Psilocybe cubensis]